MKRLLIAVAATFGLLIPMVGSSANWIGSGSIAPGTIHTGKMELWISGSSAATQTISLISAGNLIPGTTAAFNIAVSGGGDVGLNWTAFVRRGSWPSNTLEARLFDGTRTNATTCPAGSPLGSNVSVTSSDQSLTTSALHQAFMASPRNICLLVKLASSAPTGTQGATGTLIVTFKAVQEAP